MRTFRRHAAALSIAALLLPTTGCQGFGLKSKSPTQQSATPRPEVVQKPTPIVRPVADPAAPAAPDDGGVADDPQAAAVQQYIDRINAGASGGTSVADDRVVISGPAAQRPPASARPGSEMAGQATALPRGGASTSACPTPVSGSVKVKTLPRDVPLGDEEERGVSLASGEYTATIVEPTAAPDFESTSPAPAPVAPPRVKHVQVRATGPKAEPAVRLASDNVASINRPVETSQIPTSLKGFLDQYMREHGASDQRAQLEERILRVLVGDYAGARAPLTMATNEQQQLTRSIVEALISARAAHPGDAGAMSNAATQALGEMSSALRAMDELRIPEVAICWKVEGFGRYEEFSPAKFVAGRESEVIVYCELTGFASEPEGGRGFKTEFDVTSTIIDRAGNVVQKYAADGIVDRCRTRRTDCFVPHLIRLPAALAPGDYTVKVTITDKLGGKVAENRAKFTIVTSL